VTQSIPNDPASWTVEEARSYLPRLRVLLDVVRRAAEVSAKARGNGHAATSASDDLAPTAPSEETFARGAHDAFSSDMADVADMADKADMESSTLTARQALEELSDRGVVLRDLERGLVDFPSRRPSGRVVLLCWYVGEEDLAWWHLPEDGFAGRRPLPVPPEV
jgi:hypothetical protein